MGVLPVVPPGVPQVVRRDLAQRALQDVPLVLAPGVVPDARDLQASQTGG